MQIRRQLPAIIVSALFATPAFAYIDPNTGGYIFQLLAPLVAIAVSVWIFFANQVKTIWRSFLGIFSRKADKEKRDQ